MKQDIIVLRLRLQCSFDGVQVRRTLFEHQDFESPWHVADLNQKTYLLIRNIFLSHKVVLFLGWNA